MAKRNSKGHAKANGTRQNENHVKQEHKSLSRVEAGFPWKTATLMALLAVIAFFGVNYYKVFPLNPASSPEVPSEASKIVKGAVIQKRKETKEQIRARLSKTPCRDR